MLIATFILLQFLSLKSVLIIGTILWFLYRYIKKSITYFERRNVKYMKPFPMLGIVYDVVSRRMPMGFIIKEGYDRFKDSKFFGIFEYSKPMYVIRDLDLIKQIGIKDFSTFSNHRSVLSDDNKDKLFRQNLFFLKDQKWRDTRSTLSPAFTGSKMRLMFKLVAECSHTFTDNLEQQAKKAPYEVEMKSLFERYANDVIAKCIFGVSIDSIKDPENEFYKTSLKATDFPLIAQLIFIATTTYPRFAKIFGFNSMDEKMENFYLDLVKNSIDYRRKNNIVLNDLLNLMMQAQKTGSISTDDDNAHDNVGFATVSEFKDDSKTSKSSMKNWDVVDIADNCFLVIFAGFDTVSTAIHFLGHELAMNPEVQSKLIQEIDDLNESLNREDPSYEDIQKMEYMDMVVSEVLRKWPPATFQDRVCTKSYVLRDNDGTEVLLKPGDVALIPTLAIMRDPNYYPDPENFDPDRFSLENRKNLNEFSYQPFGVGPRNCIGSRFALMELKVAFYFLLLKFGIEKSPKTDISLKLKTDTFQIRSKNGVWVNLVPRK